MDPITISALIAAGVSIGSSIIGELIAAGKREEAERILNAARDEYGRLEPAKIEQAAFDVLGPSEFENVRADAQYKMAQDESLGAIKELQEGGGFNAEDRANLARMGARTQKAASNRLAQTREEMQARGIGGSGAELALRQATAQSEAERLGQEGLDTAAQAQRRYFDAVRERAGMAGQMRSQDFGEQAQRAEAADAIARFNKNFEYQQHMGNQQLAQQDFLNRQGIARDKLGLAQDRAAGITGQANRTGQMIAGAGQQAGQGILAAGQYMQAGQEDAETEAERLARIRARNAPSRNFGTSTSGT